MLEENQLKMSSMIDIKDANIRASDIEIQ